MIEVVSSEKDELSYDTGSWEQMWLPIQRNLHDALTQLRSSSKRRILWVDAVCIDQTKNIEKSQQIMRMGNIYKYAQRVVVWLGTATSDSPLALRVLAHLGNQADSSKGNTSGPTPGCTEPEWWKTADAAVIEKSPETWNAVLHLLRRPWFDRLWIRQEIQLANPSAVIQCGTEKITWQQLRRAIIRCSSFDMKMPRGTSPLLHPRLDFLYTLAVEIRGRDPLELLEHAIRTGCADPRDKIFGILGLLPDAMSRRIQARYTQPPQEVHRDALLVYLECTGKLDVLSIVGPSWIPQWTCGSDRALLTEGIFAAGNSTAEACCVAPNVLMVSGVTCDSVEAVAGPLPVDHHQLLAIISNLWPTAKSTSKMYPTGDTLAQALAWTFLRGDLQDRHPHDYANGISLSQAQRLFEQLPTPPLNSGGSFDRHVLGRSLFRTKRGYLGITEIDVMPNDTLTVLLGCPMPILIRAQPDKKHLFIACAYVHGLMDGEALLGPVPEHCKITLRRYDSGKPRQNFHDRVKQEQFPEDPRLGPLPATWKRTRAKDRLWPNVTVDAFQNTTTGEILHSDPRMLPDALRARGVALETFALI